MCQVTALQCEPINCVSSKFVATMATKIFRLRPRPRLLLSDSWRGCKIWELIKFDWLLRIGKLFNRTHTNTHTHTHTHTHTQTHTNTRKHTLRRRTRVSTSSDAEEPFLPRSISVSVSLASTFFSVMSSSCRSEGELVVEEGREEEEEEEVGRGSRGSRKRK